MIPILPELGLRTQGDAFAWALTSPCDRWRYLLGRSWARDAATWTFCMLNPSKARHDVPDQTLGKCVGFAKRHGAGAIVLVNVFAWSATDPKELVRASLEGWNVVGDHNAAAMRWAIAKAADQWLTHQGRLLSAWGKIPPKLREAGLPSRITWETLAGATDCLGSNKDGSPRHPLMLGYDTPIVHTVASATTMVTLPVEGRPT